jgi:exonuclease III
MGIKHIKFPRERNLLWDSLTVRLQLLKGTKVCLCGDFNAIRSREERRSVSAGQFASDFSHFNAFIENNVLVDLPLGGRNFTWFKGDGKSMSRIDRFLLSEDWCLLWPNCSQIAHMQSLSDHCPLVLSVDEENWGTRPFCMLK